MNGSGFEVNAQQPIGRAKRRTVKPDRVLSRPELVGSPEPGADDLMLDGNARQNLATFCQTWEEPEVIALTTSSSTSTARGT